MANADLQEKAKNLIRQDWEEENTDLLEKSNYKLSQLQEKYNLISNDLLNSQNKLKETKDEITSLEKQIDEKQKLAEDIEISVASRIKNARDHVADFIAEMSFVSGNVTYNENKNKLLNNENIISQKNNTYCFSPEVVEARCPKSRDEALSVVSIGLEEAGVSKNYRSGLSAFLYAAYLKKQPLLLIGPNAIDIAEAFCTCVSANKHGTLYCEGEYSHQNTDQIGRNGERIVIINNLLTSSWINRLPEILSNKDIFYIVTHPYSEDIQVEPKSLYNYVLPIFTEILVDKKASGKYINAVFSENLLPEPSQDSFDTYLPVLENFSLNSFTKESIISLFSTMNTIYPEITDDDRTLYFIFPIAYATMSLNKFKEHLRNINSTLNLSSDLKEELRFVLGEEE